MVWLKEISTINSDNQGSTVYTLVQILSRFSKKFWSKFTKIIPIVSALSISVKHCEGFVKLNYIFYKEKYFCITDFKNHIHYSKRYVKQNLII